MGRGRWALALAALLLAARGGAGAELARDEPDEMSEPQDDEPSSMEDESGPETNPNTPTEPPTPQEERASTTLFPPPPGKNFGGPDAYFDPENTPTPIPPSVLKYEHPAGPHLTRAVSKTKAAAHALRDAAAVLRAKAEGLRVTPMPELSVEAAFASPPAAAPAGASPSAPWAMGPIVRTKEKGWEPYVPEVAHGIFDHQDLSGFGPAFHFAPAAAAPPAAAEPHLVIHAAPPAAAPLIHSLAAPPAAAAEAEPMMPVSGDSMPPPMPHLMGGEAVDEARTLAPPPAAAFVQRRIRGGAGRLLRAHPLPAPLKAML